MKLTVLTDNHFSRAPLCLLYESQDIARPETGISKRMLRQEGGRVDGDEIENGIEGRMAIRVQGQKYAGRSS